MVMRKTLIATLLAGLLMFSAVTPAQATVRYGSRLTAAHGWIVEVKNNEPHRIRADCEWWAGHWWHTRWWINAYRSKWTTSDGGDFGDVKPRHLRCHYH